MLLFVHLDWLPMWGDELFSLSVVRLNWSRMFVVIGADIHPPLYFALLKCWLFLPWPSTALVAARALSALFLLASTVALDRFWLLSLDASRRFSVLALWTLSSCCLLYGRMARSYSLQVLLFIVAARLALDALDRGGWKRWTAACAACWALLMTHYVPGLALLAALHVVHWRLWWFDFALLVSSIPWLAAASGALLRWTQAGLIRDYSFTGNLLAEQVLKAGYTFVSFSIGESFPALALTGVLAALALSIQAVRSADRNRLTLLLAVAAALGYVAAVRWVSIVFVPARLLWLLPFVFLAWSRGSRVLLAMVAAANLFSVAGYWRQSGFINQGYLVPWNEIAGLIAQEPRQSTLVLYDRFNADGPVLAETLGRGWTVKQIRPGLDPDPTTRRVWIFRSTRDISPNRLVTQTEQRWCEGKSQTVFEYGAYPTWLRGLPRVMGAGGLPQHAYSLTRCLSP